MKVQSISGKHVINPETGKYLVGRPFKVNPRFEAYWYRRQKEGGVKILLDSVPVKKSPPPKPKRTEFNISNDKEK